MGLGVNWTISCSVVFLAGSVVTSSAHAKYLIKLVLKFIVHVGFTYRAESDIIDETVYMGVKMGGVNNCRPSSTE